VFYLAKLVFLTDWSTSIDTPKIAASPQIDAMYSVWSGAHAHAEGPLTDLGSPAHNHVPDKASNVEISETIKSKNPADMM